MKNTLKSFFFFLFIFILISLPFFHFENAYAQTCEGSIEGDIQPEPETAIFKGAGIAFEKRVSCFVYDIEGNVVFSREGCTCTEVANDPVPRAGKTVGQLRDFENEAASDPTKTVRFKVRQEVSLNWIGEGIRLLFIAAISFATVFSVLALVWAGILWMSAAGNQSVVSRAKEYISNALIGLILVFGSYLILFTLNPETANIRGIRLSQIPAVDFAYSPLISPSAIREGLYENDEEITDQELNNIANYLRNQTENGYGAECTEDHDYCKDTFGGGAEHCRTSWSWADFCCDAHQSPDLCENDVPLDGLCEHTYNCYDHITLNDAANPRQGLQKTCCANMGVNTDQGSEAHRCQYAIYTNGEWKTSSAAGQTEGLECETDFSGYD